MTTGADRRDGYDVARDYAFGSSAAETRRLTIQADILRPYTARLLDTVGVAPGMRVLDLGCGTGDTALLAATMVGPSGDVVGIDQDENVLGVARERARLAGRTNVSFRQQSVESFDEPGAFDVVTGRCVAFFSPDPASFLRSAATALRPGGRLALQEPHTRWLPAAAPDPLVGQFSSPRVEDIERVGEAFARALEAAAPAHDVALRLTEHFHDAGLPAPRLEWNVLVGAGPADPLYGLMAACFRSMYPRMVEHGITGFDDLATPALEDHLRGLAERQEIQVSFYSLLSAWVTV